ncbi:MAG: ATP synthase F1 subunit gamma [Oscillospiraceae bacterium]
MKDIKNRIKSVESTMQITKAMELVASSKLRKAKERAEKNKPYFHTLYETISEIAAANKSESSQFLKAKSEIKKSLFIIISGDRGLAGGYNSNIFKLAENQMKDKTPVIICVGKKTIEYFSKKPYEIIASYPNTAENITMDDSIEIGTIMAQNFLKGDFDEAFIVFTTFVSALNQQPTALKLLPLDFCVKDNSSNEFVSYEPSPSVVFSELVPQFLSGMIYGSVCESFVSEQAARQSAMKSASDNAQQMVDDLNLKFNRARQGAITQEITEIVAGANASS